MKNKFIFLIIFGIFLLISCIKNNVETPIPLYSKQMILVVTDSMKATKGKMYLYERKNVNTDWKLVNDKINVLVGRNGLGWGRGLHKIPRNSKFPIKKEGDERSPAGVFKLSSIFGYNSVEKMKNLRMPYIHLTKEVECIDDVKSKYYGEIISKDSVENIDWNSSEKMSFSGIYYKLGIVVEHNCNPIKKDFGSCIFIHNWGKPNETTSGCTEMHPIKTKEVVYWLDELKNPILVQLTKQLYFDLIEEWKLPNIIEKN